MRGCAENRRQRITRQLLEILIWPEPRTRDVIVRPDYVASYREVRGYVKPYPVLLFRRWQYLPSHLPPNANAVVA